MVSPGIGLDTVTVTVRDASNNPCPYVLVEVDVSDCSGLCIDTPNGLSAVTDSNGVAYIDARVGGCDACNVVVRADGITIRTYSRIVSADWDGSWADGVVDSLDLDFLMLYYNVSYEVCADYNGDGLVDISDFSFLGDFWGNANSVPCPYNSCEVEPASIDFDSVSVVDSKDRTFTIRNTGGATLTGSVSESCPHYSIVNGGGPYSIPSGDTLVVTVRLEPADTGMHNCTIDTGDSVCVDVSCTGVGTPPPPECFVQPDTLDFGTVYVGSSSCMTFTIFNIGGGILTGNVSESCLHYSIVSGGGAYSIAGGDSIEVEVCFEPATEGTHNCTVELGQPLCPNVLLTGVVGAEPFILSISDVGNDQGRNVRINFHGSPRDSQGSPSPILQYEAYRRIDPLPLTASLESGHDEGPIDTEIRVRQARESGMLSFPATVLLENWEYAGAIPAHGETIYNMIAPTLADSTKTNGMHWSVFFIRAATADPLTYFDSPIDSGYSLDNLPPGVPGGFSVAYNTGSGNQLAWDPSEDEDFQYFKVYRSTDPDFTPTPDDLVHLTIEVTWLDPISEGWQYHYKVSAVDFSGNESDATSPVSITGDEGTTAPKVFALYQNVPNLFNPTTTIRFDLPRATHVKLSIYNLRDELVATPMNKHMTEGRKEISWNARSDRGRALASGVYFYRLIAGDFVQTKKMVLLR
ncbi:MAG: choice-of-anchor D domain-containing protein [bacterium]|nr:MAG: choice-of-anchor D domain-containing protein [bacterium]